MVVLRNEDSSGDRIVLEEFTQEGDRYAGDVIVQETQTGTGDITDLFLSNGGNGYKTTPVLTITSSSGSGGKIRAFGNGIGKVNGLKPLNTEKDTKLRCSNIKFLSKLFSSRYYQVHL